MLLYKKNSKNAIDDIEKLIKETKKEMKKALVTLFFMMHINISKKNLM